jgi:hypothetical protein
MSTIPSLLESFCTRIKEAPSIPFRTLRVSANLMTNERADIITFSVKSTQKKVVLSINPGSMKADYQTQSLNRMMKLGYDSVSAPTTGMLSRR